jgi:hypothetical protein
MKTADEIMEKHYNMDKDEDRNKIFYPWSVKNAMIEFAKLHVKAAIKECIESAPSGSSTDTVSYEDVVECLKDCYPETLIK